MKLKALAVSWAFLVGSFSVVFADDHSEARAAPVPTPSIQTTDRGTKICVIEGCANWDEVKQRFQEFGIPLAGIVRLTLPESIAKTIPEEVLKGMGNLEAVVSPDGRALFENSNKGRPDGGEAPPVPASSQPQPSDSSWQAFDSAPVVATPVSQNEMPSKIKITTSDHRTLESDLKGSEAFDNWLVSQNVQAEDVTELVFYVNNPFDLGVINSFSNLKQLKVIGRIPVTLCAFQFWNLSRLEELDLRGLSNANFETLEFWYQRPQKGAHVASSILDPKDQRTKVCMNALSKEQELQIKEQLAPMYPNRTHEEVLQASLRDLLSRAPAFVQEFVYCFYGCPKLEKVLLPKMMTVVAPDLFRGASKLKTVVFSSETQEIGAQAFAGCTALNIVDLSNTGLKKIGDGAFRECFSLERILLPNTLVSIGNQAFSGCEALKLPDLPASISHIGNNAFSGCASFTSVDLSRFAYLKEISDGCFCSCQNLSSFVLPGSVVRIGKNAFCETAIKELDLSRYTELATIDDGAFQECSELTKVVFPVSLKSLGFVDAFSECPLLKDLVFPQGNQLQSLRCAFQECGSLTSVDLSHCTCLTEIGVSAFQHCSSLKEVKLPQTTQKICDYAFNDCLTLEHINVEDCHQLTLIGSYAFSRDECLKEMHFPASLTTVDQCAFSECTGLSKVDFSRCQTLKINTAGFFGTTSLVQVLFPKGGNVALGDRAFKKSKVSSKLPACIKEVGKEAWPVWD